MPSALVTLEVSEYSRFMRLSRHQFVHDAPGPLETSISPVHYWVRSKPLREFVVMYVLATEIKTKDHLFILLLKNHSNCPAGQGCLVGNSSHFMMQLDTATFYSLHTDCRWDSHPYKHHKQTPLCKDVTSSKGMQWFTDSLHMGLLCFPQTFQVKPAEPWAQGSSLAGLAKHRTHSLYLGGWVAGSRQTPGPLITQYSGGAWGAHGTRSCGRELGMGWPGKGGQKRLNIWLNLCRVPSPIGKRDITTDVCCFL